MGVVSDEGAHEEAFDITVIVVVCLAGAVVVWNTDIKMNQIDQMLGLRGNQTPGRKPQPANSLPH